MTEPLPELQAMPVRRVLDGELVSHEPELAPV
jgi:hypothetical protein